MTRCAAFYEKVECDGNFCGMSDGSYKEVMRYREFVEEHDEFSSFTAGSLMPLIREPSPEVQQRIFKKVDDNIKKFGKDIGAERIKEEFGTEKKMRIGLNKYREDPLAIEKEEPKSRVLCNADFADEVGVFIRWCYTQREEDVIEEVINKALVSERPLNGSLRG